MTDAVPAEYEVHQRDTLPLPESNGRDTLPAIDELEALVEQERYIASTNPPPPAESVDDVMVPSTRIPNI